MADHVNPDPAVRRAGYAVDALVAALDAVKATTVEPAGTVAEVRFGVDPQGHVTWAVEYRVVIGNAPSALDARRAAVDGGSKAARYAVLAAWLREFDVAPRPHWTDEARGVTSWSARDDEVAAALAEDDAEAADTAPEHRARTYAARLAAAPNDFGRWVDENTAPASLAGAPTRVGPADQS